MAPSLSGGRHGSIRRWRHALQDALVRGLVWATACAVMWVPASAAGQRALDGSRPQVGLALSGGSAKGFAHIGVLEELERAGIPIDAVAGTSMGSIVGGLYAIGYTPAMLRHVSETEDWEGVFHTPVVRSELHPLRKLGDGRYLLTVPIRGGRVDLPTAVIGSQSVATILSRLVWAADTTHDLRQLPIPFVAVATDLDTCESVTLDHCPLSVAMRASMSLPGVFDPVRIDGRRLVDGGVARNLPVLDVRSLGAEITICVDVSDPLSASDSLTSAFGILMQIVTYRMQESTSAERASCSVLIEPDIQGLGATSFGASAQWIERGAAATRAALPAVRAALESRGVALVGGPEVPSRELPARKGAQFPRQLRIRDVTIHGDSTARRTIAALDVRGKMMSAVDAERVASHLFASGRYTLVASRPTVTPEGVDLLLDVLPANPNQVGLGLRFDSRYKAALLFGAHLNDWLGAGSAFTVDVRLGEQFLAQARYLPAVPGAQWLVRSLSASVMQTPLELFVSDLAVARAQVRMLSASAFAGAVFPSSTISGIRLTTELGRTSAEIAPVAADAVRKTYFTVSAISWTETFDRAVFPTRGMSLYAQTEVASRRIGSGANFGRTVVDGELRRAINPGTTLVGRVVLGAAHGEDLPLYDRFFLGGTILSAVLPGRSFAFAALDDEERSGRALQLAELGVQQRIGPTRFVTLRGTVGDTFDRWPRQLAAADYLGGVSLA
ncbi:MAG: patatin-like phospholipase family protein, partial [Gemmatimonadaceae bacterium]|nr:patatin-like phospholipase family protein [Gemmatimonadaceae bacterium]